MRFQQISMPWDRVRNPRQRFCCRVLPARHGAYGADRARQDGTAQGRGLQSPQRPRLGRPADVRSHCPAPACLRRCAQRPATLRPAGLSLGVRPPRPSWMLNLLRFKGGHGSPGETSYQEYLRAQGDQELERRLIMKGYARTVIGEKTSTI